MKDRREIVLVSIILTILLATLGCVYVRQVGRPVENRVRYLANTTGNTTHTHYWGTGKVTKAATCTTAGVRTYTCSCGQTKTSSIPANGHDWEDDVSRESTCTQYGLATPVCKTCGKRDAIKYLPKAEHVVNTSVGRSGTGGWFDDNATYHYQRCKNCGEEINKGNHNDDGRYGLGLHCCSICYRASGSNIEVTNVDIGSSSQTLDLNGRTSITLAVTVTPESAKNQVVWTSGNTAVATVNTNGKVTAVGPGKTTITASAGTKSDTCSITVISCNTIEDLAKYGHRGNVYYSDINDNTHTATTKCLVCDTVVKTETNVKHTYNLNSNNGMVCVCGKQAPDDTTLTPKPAATPTAKPTATPTPKPTATLTKIEVVPSSVLLEIGGTESATLTAKATYSDGTTKNVGAIWSGGNDYVDLAIMTGRVTAKKAGGSATIKATYEGKTATCTVKVIVSSKHTSHTWDSGVVTKAATCTTDGVKTYTCKCGQTKTETITKLGHDFPTSGGTIVAQPTCTQNGGMLVQCTRCSTKTSITVTALGHNYVNGKCTRCGATQPTNATATPKPTATPAPSKWCANCTAGGNHHAQCTGTKIYNDLGNGKHSVKCCDGSTTLGQEVHHYANGKCKECGASESTPTPTPTPTKCTQTYLVQDHVNAEYANPYYEAIDEKTHKMYWECTKCNVSMIESNVPPEEHQFVNGKCKLCGEKEPVKPHVHDKKGTQKLSAEPPTLSEHLLIKTCSICGEEQYPAVWEDHKPDNNGKCTVCGYQMSKNPESIDIIGNGSKTIYVGDSITLSTTITPPWATKDKITWSSSDSTVVSVSSSGQITGKKVGNKITITAKTSNGKVATILVNVITRDTSVCSECIAGRHSGCTQLRNWIKLNEKSHYRTCCDGVQEFTENHKLGSWQIETVNDIHYRVCSVCNARVNEGKHTYDDNGKCVCGKTTEKKSQTITLKGASEVKVGSTITLEASSSLKNAKASWDIYSISGNGNATISGLGDKITLKGVTEGTVQVVVKYTPADSDKSTYKEGSKSTTIKIVKADVQPESISLNPTYKEIYEGDTFNLSATIKPNGTNTTLTWKSDNEKVATVNDGKVRGIAKGSTTITVTTANGKKATCKVTVNTKSTSETVTTVAVSKITVSPTSKTIKVDEEFKVTATISPNDATNKTVYWSSSDESIATVSKDGNVKGIGKGSATITATSSNGKTATCKVTVQDITKATSIKFQKDEYYFKLGEKVELEKLLTITPNKADVSLKFEFVEDAQKELAVLGTYTGKIEFTSIAKLRIMATDLNTNKYTTTIINIEANPEYSARPTINGDRFRDVSKDDWYYETIKKSVEDGLFKGTSETEFSPNETITRGMFITVLARFDGADSSDYEEIFTDVPRNAYYSNAISWAVVKGIANGVSDGRFAPDETMSREEMATVIYNYIKTQQKSALKGKKISKKLYNDQEQISTWSEEAIDALSTLGIIQGNDDGTYRPHNGVTRAEAATIMQRLTKLTKTK